MVVSDADANVRSAQKRSKRCGNSTRKTRNRTRYPSEETDLSWLTLNSDYNYSKSMAISISDCQRKSTKIAIWWCTEKINRQQSDFSNPGRTTILIRRRCESRFQFHVMRLLLSLRFELQRNGHFGYLGVSVMKTESRNRVHSWPMLVMRSSWCTVRWRSEKRGFQAVLIAGGRSNIVMEVSDR